MDSMYACTKSMGLKYGYEVSVLSLGAKSGYESGWVRVWVRVRVRVWKQ
jgi:hypothetical protein